MWYDHTHRRSARYQSPANARRFLVSGLRWDSSARDIAIRSWLGELVSLLLLVGLFKFHCYLLEGHVAFNWYRDCCHANVHEVDGGTFRYLEFEFAIEVGNCT